MDNITHSLFGLAIAETTLQARRSKLRTPFYIASVAANNLPDLDILYAGFLSKPLGYLLHHRGFTHTLLMLMPEGFLVLLGMFLYSRWRKEKWSSADWRAIALLSFLGIAVHILLDSLNSYGVHPFWPFINTWFYLDSVFILEPMFWLALVPALAIVADTKVKRAVYWGIFLGALGLVLYVRFIPGIVKFCYALFGVGFVVSAHYFNSLQRSILSLCYCAIFASSMIILSQGVDNAVRSRLEHSLPEDSIEDVVRTPYPGNPFCWSVIAVGTNPQTANYWVRMGHYHFPFSPRSSRFCRPYAEEATNPAVKTLAFDPESEANGLTWQRIFERPLVELQSLAKNSCGFNAFLQFSRVPFWTQSGDGILAGDLRFIRGSAKGFSEFSLSSRVECPKQVPGWKPPIHELLGVHD